ncbi:Vacuolar protein sorting-associated protein atg6 [Asimina triloba]
MENLLDGAFSLVNVHHASADGSVSGSTRMDHSFVVLPKQRSQAPGVPPRPRQGASQPDSSQSGKTMEESFVVLPPAAASMYKCEPMSGNPNLQTPGPLQANNPGFHSSITVLKRAFDIATSQTQVDQPLCLECMRVLSDKLDKEVEDVNRDIKAYEACLQRLELESRDALSEADFLREKKKVEEEERRLEAAIEEAEKQCAAVEIERMELELKSKRFKELEERYWHEFNKFQFQLTSHQVEWDEINAAWGQACLLLHTMAQYFRPKFQYPLYQIKILPMGSYPRIMDTNNSTYELFGPVNLFWSTRYDKAMTLFLACLKDFAEFAHSMDLENNIPPEKCFKLPYKIENDRVENYTITQSFNKQENWTKALKYMLCDLKWALFWFVGNTHFQPLYAVLLQTPTGLQQLGVRVLLLSEIFCSPESVCSRGSILKLISMYRRSISSTYSLLSPRFHPSFAHIVLHNDDDKAHSAPVRDPPRPHVDNSPLQDFNRGYSNNIVGFSALLHGRGGFNSLPLGIGHSFRSYSSSTIGDGSDKVQYISDPASVWTEQGLEAVGISDAASILTEKGMEAVVSQAPVASEVAVAAADSFLPVAVLQYFIDGVHNLTGLNW